MQDDGEEDERRRAQRERQRMASLDRLYDHVPRRMVDGFVDDGDRPRRRRMEQISMRVHPRIKAMMLFVKKRDNIPSMPMFLELMFETYLKEYGRIDESDMPGLEELSKATENQSRRRR